MSRYQTNPLIQEDAGSLFGRVMALLSGMNLLTALGVYMTFGVAMSGDMAIMLLIFYFGAFIVTLVTARSDVGTVAILPAGLFAVASGALLGPAIHQYVQWIGFDTVLLAVASTAAVTALLGFIAFGTQIFFQKMEGILMIALLGLIFVGVINIFMAFSAAANLLHAGVGMLVFAGFFLVDFAILRDSSKVGEYTGWGAAIMVTVNLYLDMLNFFLYLLKFLAASKSDD